MVKVNRTDVVQTTSLPITDHDYTYALSMCHFLVQHVDLKKALEKILLQIIMISRYWGNTQGCYVYKLAASHPGLSHIQGFVKVIPYHLLYLGYCLGSGVTVSDLGILCLLYAVDIAIIHDSEQDLQVMLIQNAKCGE